MKNILAVLCSVVLTLLGVPGCQEGPGETAGLGTLTMYMTDSPASYDAVNIVVARVEVHLAGGGWITVNDSLRTFNLLSLRNGAVTLLGSAGLSVGHYTQIRLILGAGSNVVVNGQTFNLTVPSNEVKLVHQFTIEAGTEYQLLLDFDAARSVLYANGSYHLKPTIRVRAVAQAGSIAGEVVTTASTALVTATSVNDTATTYTDANGYFKLLGLMPGAYTLSIQSTQSSNVDVTIDSIEVRAGVTTNVGVIVLTRP